MDTNERAIKLIMIANNLQLEIKVAREYIFSGKIYACFKVSVNQKETKKNELYFHICYSYSEYKNIVEFEEANVQKGIYDSVFELISDDRAVYNYFQKETKKFATNYFEKKYLNFDYER